MNEEIIAIMKADVREKGITMTHLAKKTGIPYTRIQRIFSQDATISGSELLLLSRELSLGEKIFSLATLPQQEARP